MREIKSLPQPWIEPIRKYYTARVGVWRDRSYAEALLADVHTIAPGATVRKAFYRKEPIIVPDSFHAPGPASGVEFVLHGPSQEQVKEQTKPSSTAQPPAE